MGPFVEELVGPFVEELVGPFDAPAPFFPVFPPGASDPVVVVEGSWEADGVLPETVSCVPLFEPFDALATRAPIPPVRMNTQTATAPRMREFSSTQPTQPRRGNATLSSLWGWVATRGLSTRNPW